MSSIKEPEVKTLAQETALREVELLPSVNQTGSYSVLGRKQAAGQRRRSTAWHPRVPGAVLSLSLFLGTSALTLLLSSLKLPLSFP